MILGIGVDIIEVGRIRAAVERHGERFCRRILHEAELVYCRAHRDPMPFLAARFAAKEAVSKAFGTGFGQHLGWLDIEVQRRESGQPFVVLHGKGQALFDQRGGRGFHLTLSHTDNAAVAVAILEG